MAAAKMYVTVDVEQGTLRGQQKTSEYFTRNKYYSFQGIPYAKPPLGSLRFKDPEEPDPWIGIRDALKEGNDAVQHHMLYHNLIGSEDCLYLNVYTTQLDGHRKPVMVWIHGGGFNSGSGSTELYGPDYLMEHDVVLVTINYRVGVLGFLSLHHEEVPGNAGLKDQVMALTWIQKNISSFGGDRENVTLFGESAGGASVYYHLLSPLPKGLFHRAVIQSGSPLNPWAYCNRDVAVDRAFKLGRELGCDTTDTNKLLQFLRDVPANVFPDASIRTLYKDEVQQNLMLPFLPCVESPAMDSSFLTQTPRELLKQGLITKVPTIVGSTEAEGFICIAVSNIKEETLEAENEDFQKFVPVNMGLDKHSESLKAVSEIIKEFYFGNKLISVETFYQYLSVYGDILFDVGIDEAIRMQLKNSSVAVYAYEFTFHGPRSLLRTTLKPIFPSIELKGVSHGDDMLILFSQNLKDVKKPNTDEQDFIAKVTKMWATFAKTGNPNFKGLQAKWEPTRKDNFCHLQIGNELKMVTERVKESRVKMWQQLYEKYSHAF